jgi:O-antigen/teichoic acid export membrane protein
MRSSGKALLFNAAWSAIPNVLAILVGLVTIPAYVAFLGIENYGLYVLLNTFVGPLALLQVNLGQAAAIYIARAEATGDMPQVQRYVSNGLLFNLIVGVAGAAAIVLAVNIFSPSFFGVSPGRFELSKNCMVLVAATWFVNQPTDLFLNISYSLQKFDAYSSMKSGQMIVGSLAGLAVAYHTRSILSLFQVQLLLSALYCGIWYLLARRMLPRVRFKAGFDLDTFRRTVRFGFWQTLSQAFGLIHGCGDKMIIGYMLSVAEVGYYNIAKNISDYTYMFLFSGVRVLAPYISQQEALGRDDRQARLIGFGSWVVACATTACYMSFFVLGEDLLRVWINPAAAREAAGVLKILMVATTFSSLGFIPGEFAIGKARPELVTGMTIFKGVAMLAIAPLAVERFRLDGIGLGTLAGAMSTIPYLYFVWRFFFQKQVELRNYWTPFLAPVLSGLAAALALSGCVQILGLHPRSMAALVPSFAGVFLLLAFCIVGASAAAPSCRPWISDLFDLASRARRHLAGRLAA